MNINISYKYENFAFIRELVIWAMLNTNFSCQALIFRIPPQNNCYFCVKCSNRAFHQYYSFPTVRNKWKVVVRSLIFIAPLWGQTGHTPAGPADDVTDEVGICVCEQCVCKTPYVCTGMSSRLWSKFLVQL